MNSPFPTYPTHVFQFCPRCAKAFQSQADNSFVCTACGFHYYINANAAVCALIEDERGRLLLTVRAREPQKGTLDLPGGFVDPGESAEEALRREIREELNLEIRAMNYMGSFPNQYIFSNLTYFTLDLAFMCRVHDFSPMKADDDVERIIFEYPQAIDLGAIGFVSIRNIIKQLYPTPA